MTKYFFSLIFCALIISGCSKPTSNASFTPDPRFEIISAEEWGSNPDSLAGREHTPKYVTIHHAGTEWTKGSDTVEKLKNLQSWGKREKDWPDLPYHYLISPDGKIYEGRSTDYEPETNTSFDTNGHLNVHLYGNFEVQRVNEAQLESAVYISAYLMDKFDVPLETLGGHKDRAETACPGKDLYRYIEDGTMSQWVGAYLEGKTPTITLKQALPDGPTNFIEQ